MTERFQGISKCFETFEKIINDFKMFYNFLNWRGSKIFLKF